MLRKSPIIEDEKLDRWLISYADFITLLFAFFVVMYSISQVNEGKYRVLSDTLLTVFDPAEKRKLERSGTSVIANDLIESSTNSEIDSSSTNAIDPIQEHNPNNYADVEEFNRIEKILSESLAPLIDEDLVTIKKSKDFIEIDMRSALLFGSGSDVLSASAKVVLEEVAKSVKNNKHRINVRGHTDNVPIASEQFGSNWALSAARAVSVVRLLQNLQISPRRLTAEGYGEFAPLESNATELGRAKNRRVTVAISRYLLEESSNDGESVDEVEQQTPVLSEVINHKEGSKTVTEPTFEVVRLPNGGLLIRGKPLPEKPQNKDSKGDSQ